MEGKRGAVSYSWSCGSETTCVDGEGTRHVFDRGWPSALEWALLVGFLLGPKVKMEPILMGLSWVLLLGPSDLVLQSPFELCIVNFEARTHLSFFISSVWSLSWPFQLGPWTFFFYISEEKAYLSRWNPGPVEYCTDLIKRVRRKQNPESRNMAPRLKLCFWFLAKYDVVNWEFGSDVL